MKNVYLWASSIVICCLVGCAGEPVQEGSAGEAVQRLATAEDIEHACSHAQSPTGGAYTNVSAVTSGTAPFLVEHGAYNVTLPGSGSSYAGKVAFEADEDAEHAFYTDPSVTITVKLGTTVLTPVWSTTLTAEECAGSSNTSLPDYGTDAALSYVKTYDLESGETYSVEFTNTSATLLVIPENLEE
ncbi:hypothetical protein [Polyangium sorediatum]|uniref:Lipoprotein n=1 Tax=Polyangium sorediatum TaxID=889274 RepID=A0ABT6P2Y6_9BACT|nr:hypothetical protein [Polyangium sorediatum]MDI1434966.1 hypothetical protein [Polyangium sorediatum]